MWPDEELPEDIQPRIAEPPPSTILNQRLATLRSEGSLITAGFGPMLFSTVDFVAVPRIDPLDDISEDLGCAYVRFEDFIEVLAPKITDLGPSGWYAPPDISQEALEQAAQQVIPSPMPAGGHFVSGVDPQELTSLRDILRPVFDRYFLPGINLRNPQDLDLYRQLVARNVEPPPFSHTHGDWIKAVRQMHIWFP